LGNEKQIRMTISSGSDQKESIVHNLYSL